MAEHQKGDMSPTDDGARLSFADMAKQHLIESLFNNKDGWSLPIYKGKPMKPKDMLRSTPVTSRQGQGQGKGHNNRSQAMVLVEVLMLPYRTRNIRLVYSLQGMILVPMVTL